MADSLRGYVGFVRALGGIALAALGVAFMVAAANDGMTGLLVIDLVTTAVALVIAMWAANLWQAAAIAHERGDAMERELARLHARLDEKWGPQPGAQPLAKKSETTAEEVADGEYQEVPDDFHFGAPPPPKLER